MVLGDLGGPLDRSWAFTYASGHGNLRMLKQLIGTSETSLKNADSSNVFP